MVFHLLFCSASIFENGFNFFSGGLNAGLHRLHVATEYLVSCTADGEILLANAVSSNISCSSRDSTEREEEIGGYTRYPSTGNFRAEHEEGKRVSIMTQISQACSRGCRENKRTSCDGYGSFTALPRGNCCIG
jgi:hypothetical protein